MFKVLPVLGLALTLTLLMACGEVRTVSYTYTKVNMTQQLLIDDEVRLKNTSGVMQVIPKLDDKKTARIVIIVDEEQKAPGLRLLSDLGYHQVSN
jgi:hypothetical protein